MPISRETVDHVARLARLEFTEDERNRFAEQLGRILDYVSKLAELDTSKVEPLTHTLDLSTPLREDEPRPGLSTGDALTNAPDRKGDLFRVPPAIE